MTSDRFQDWVDPSAAAGGGGIKSGNGGDASSDIAATLRDVTLLCEAVEGLAAAVRAGSQSPPAGTEGGRTQHGHARQAAAAALPPPPPPPPPARYVFRPFAHSSEYKEKRRLARYLADTRAATALRPYLGRTRLAKAAAALDGDGAASSDARSGSRRRSRPVVGGGASLADYERRLPPAEKLPRTLTRAERVVLLHAQRCVRRLRAPQPQQRQPPHHHRSSRRPLARLKAAALAVRAAVRAGNAAEAGVFGFAGSTAGSLRRQRQPQQPGGRGRSPRHRPGGGGGGGGGSGDSTISTYRGSVSETPPDVPVSGGHFFRTHSSFSCASSAVSAWREERRRCGGAGGGSGADRGGRQQRLRPRRAGGDGGGGGGSGYHTSPPSSPASSPAGLSRSGRSVPVSFDLDMQLPEDTPPLMPSGGGGGFGGSVSSSFASGDELYPHSRRRPQLTRRVLRDESPQAHTRHGGRRTAATPAAEAEAAAEAQQRRQQQQERHLVEVRDSCASSSHALAGLLDAFLREAAAAASVRRRRGGASSAAQSPARASSSPLPSSPPVAAAAAERLHGEVAGAAGAAEAHHVAAVAHAVDALRAAAGDAAELDAVARVDALQARLDTLRRYCADRGISPSRSGRGGSGGGGGTSSSASSRTSSLSRSASSFASSRTAEGDDGALLSASTASSAAGVGGRRDGASLSSSSPSSSADEEGDDSAAKLRAEQTARRDLLASMRRIRHGVVRGRGACDFFARATTAAAPHAPSQSSDAEDAEDPVVRDDGFLGPLHRLCVRPASAAPRSGDDERSAHDRARPVGARLVRYRYRRRRRGGQRRTDGVHAVSGGEDEAADDDGGVSLVTDSSASPAAAVARRARRARRESGQQARPLWRGPKQAGAQARRREAPCGTPALLSGCGGVGPLRFGDEDDGVLEDELYFFLYGKGGEPAAAAAAAASAALPQPLSHRVSRGSVLPAPQATGPARDCADASVQCALVCGATEAAALAVSPSPLQEQLRPHGSFRAGGVGSTGVTSEDEPLSLGTGPSVPQEATPSALPLPSTPDADPLLPRVVLSPADTRSSGSSSGACCEEAAVASDASGVCEEGSHAAAVRCAAAGEGEPSPPSPVPAESASAEESAADACGVAAAAAVAVAGVACVLEEGAAGTLSRMRAEQRDILTALKKVYGGGGDSVPPSRSPSDVSEAPPSPLPSPSALPPRVLADPFEQLEMCIVSLGDVDLSGSDDATSLTDDSFGSSSSVDGRPARILCGSDNSDLEWARAIRSRGHVLGGGGGTVPSATQLVMMTDSTESSCVGDTDGEETHGVSAAATLWGGGGGGPTEGFCDDSFSSYGSLSRHSSDASLS